MKKIFLSIAFIISIFGANAQVSNVINPLKKNAFAIFPDSVFLVSKAVIYAKQVNDSTVQVFCHNKNYSGVTQYLVSGTLHNFIDPINYWWASYFVFLNLANLGGGSSPAAFNVFYINSFNKVVSKQYPLAKTALTIDTQTPQKLYVTQHPQLVNLIIRD